MQEGESSLGFLPVESEIAQGAFDTVGELPSMPGLIRSDNSSPGTRDGVIDGPPLSPADKKRNKLGYHRTAVACGHCRRRKIRCISAFEDPGGRCQNCIRLKKDCHFFPVDQQHPVPGKRARAATKASDALLDRQPPISTTSPSGLLRSTSVDQLNPTENLLDTPPLSRDSPGYPAFQPPPRSMSLHGLGFGQHFDTSQQHRSSQAVVSSSYSPRSYGSDQFDSHLYQQQQYGQSLPTQYSSAVGLPSYPPPMTTTGQEIAYGYSTTALTGSHTWAHPTRSLSSDDGEEISTGFSTPFRTNTYPSFERRMTGEPQQLPPVSSRLMTEGMGNPQIAMHSRYPGPTLYQPLEMQHSWTNGSTDQLQQTPTTGAGSYAHVWYQSDALVGQQDAAGERRLLSSQHQFPQSQSQPG